MQLFKKQIYFQSTNVATINKNGKNNNNISVYPLLDTRFNQYRVAYRYRRSAELLRGYLVYRLFSISFLVNNQAKVKSLKKNN